MNPKDPQAELRHSIHMKMLEKSESAKDAGELTVIPLGFAVTIATELIQAHQQEAFRNGQLDCQKAGDPTNHVHYKESVQQCPPQEKG